MMIRYDSKGFGVVEATVIAVIVLGLAGVGYWVFNRQSVEESSKTPNLSQGENIDAPAAPELNSTSDLAAVAGVLDELNFEVGSSDNAELDVQSNGLQQQ